MIILVSRNVNGGGRAASIEFGPELGEENTRAAMPDAENDQVEAELADELPHYQYCSLSVSNTNSVAGPRSLEIIRFAL